MNIKLCRGISVYSCVIFHKTNKQTNKQKIKKTDFIKKEDRLHKKKHIVKEKNLLRFLNRYNPNIKGIPIEYTIIIKTANGMKLL